MELLQDSDSSYSTIAPHWSSSYPGYLSPDQDQEEQQRVVWARLHSHHSNLAHRLSKQKEHYLALGQELNPKMTQVESSHDPLYRDKLGVSLGSLWGIVGEEGLPLSLEGVLEVLEGSSSESSIIGFLEVSCASSLIGTSIDNAIDELL